MKNSILLLKTLLLSTSSRNIYRHTRDKKKNIWSFSSIRMNGECTETKMLINIPHKWLWTLIHDRINTEVCICFFSNFL